MLVVTPNTVLAQNTDKVGHVFIALKTALVASGLWRVRGSGDGTSTFQLMGQTAGVSGSYDVLTGNGGLGYGTTASYPGPSATFSRSGAWMVLEEIASGRCLTLQRGSSSQLHMCGRLSLGGVAASGASNTAVPAAVGTSSLIFAGSAMNGGGSNFWVNATSPWGNPGNTLEVHLGVSESARVANVCPFYAFTFDRTDKNHLGCVMYESLLSPLGGLSHPLAVVASRIGEAVGVNGFMSNFWVGGDALASVRPCGFVTPAGNVPPTSITLDPDGVFRTKPLEFRFATGSTWLGISEHYVVNPGDFAGRPYAHTYNLSLPEPQPRLSIAGVLVPWRSGVGASASPDADHLDLRYELVVFDVQPPVVSEQNPSPGASLTKYQSVSFKITDDTRLAFSAVFVRYRRRNDVVYRYDVVWDGVAASPLYNVTREAVTGGYRYTVSCKAGWPAAPEFTARAIDGGGTLDEDD